MFGLSLGAAYAVPYRTEGITGSDSENIDGEVQHECLSPLHERKWGKSTTETHTLNIIYAAINPILRHRCEKDMSRVALKR